MSERRLGDAAFAGRFVFEVEDPGSEDRTVGSFAEVSGLSVEVTTEEVREGGVNQVHRLPAQTTWPNIVLKRGVIDSDALFAWLRETTQGLQGKGRLHRTTGRVSLLDAKGGPLRTWEFVGAFPVKWTGPTLAASSSDVASEELEIAHQGFTSG